nr:MAG TPA: hypothetical protein [Caudoviricetes sp.]DAZ32951.1 MAG TPA: hypothetical protein [Caudoviricetes sp.]
MSQYLQCATIVNTKLTRGYTATPIFYVLTITHKRTETHLYPPLHCKLSSLYSVRGGLSRS